MIADGNNNELMFNFIDILFAPVNYSRSERLALFCSPPTDKRQTQCLRHPPPAVTGQPSLLDRYTAGIIASTTARSAIIDAIPRNNKDRDEASSTPRYFARQEPRKTNKLNFVLEDNIRY